MKFRVGDVCEIVAPEFPEYHGRECTVTRPAEWADDICDLGSGENLQSGMYYTIEIAGEDAQTYAMENELRLKRPPSWDSWIHDTRDVELEQAVTA